MESISPELTLVYHKMGARMLAQMISGQAELLEFKPPSMSKQLTGGCFVAATTYVDDVEIRCRLVLPDGLTFKHLGVWHEVWKFNRAQQNNLLLLAGEIEPHNAETGEFEHHVTKTASKIWLKELIKHSSPQMLSLLGGKEKIVRDIYVEALDLMSQAVIWQSYNEDEKLWPVAFLQLSNKDIAPFVLSQEAFGVLEHYWKLPAEASMPVS